jgi:hypothetical protein
VRQKAQQVEQALQELVEETRLAESRLQAEQQRLVRETALKQRESEFKLLVQEQETQFQSRAQEAVLAHTRAEALARLELEEAANRVKMAYAEQEVAVERLRQEVRNSIGQGDLSGRLIDRLPELAAHMPEVHELKVLQSGAGDGAFDALAVFLAKMVALGETLGIRGETKRLSETE